MNEHTLTQLGNVAAAICKINLAARYCPDTEDGDSYLNEFEAALEEINADAPPEVQAIIQDLYQDMSAGVSNSDTVDGQCAARDAFVRRLADLHQDV